MKNLFYFFIVMGLCISCNSPTPEFRTSPNDYNEYLGADLQSKKNANDNVSFWSQRLDSDTTGLGDIAGLAGAYTSLFETSGDIVRLKTSEKLYLKAIEVAADKDKYERALAHNYISQHRFKDARTILEKSYAGPSNKHETELMLFDVYMELGEYEKAYEFLNKVKNPSDYNYLIRLSKWSDHRGDLDAAIKYMEQAKDIAESGDVKALKIWSYSNLADYYGHAGRISDSYEYYLKTLELQPDNFYVKKGIAWIIYSKERNTEEALRILDTLSGKHPVPDYLLLKSEISEYLGDMDTSKKYLNKFVETATDPSYGDMYNAYLIEILAESAPEKAMQLALREIGNRETPETYHLMAIAQLKNGEKKKALQTIETYVKGKTSEPMALYHSALIYKANGLQKEVEELKGELLDASFEIGPVLTAEVRNF